MFENIISDKGLESCVFRVKSRILRRHQNLKKLTPFFFEIMLSNVKAKLGLFFEIFVAFSEYLNFRPAVFAQNSYPKMTLFPTY